MALLLVAATDASAGKTRTKSNNSNDRAAPEGVVLQDTAVGANACSTGSGSWSWAISSVSTMAGGPGGGAAAASYARAADAQADIGAACDAAQSAIDRINGDATRLAAMDAAIDAQDAAAIEKLLIESGLSGPLAAGARYHAISTKGTGGTRSLMPDPGSSEAEDQASAAVAGRKAQDMPNRISMNVTVARTTGGLSFTVGRSVKNKNGHVTLNR
ncbi:MAG: hypothetical protein WAZ48_13945 [Lysobacteraceae bacterium]